MLQTGGIRPVQPPRLSAFLCLLSITRKKCRSPLLRLPRQCSRSEALSRLHTSQRIKLCALLLECVETTSSSRPSFRASQSLLRSCARQGCKTCPLTAMTNPTMSAARFCRLPRLGRLVAGLATRGRAGPLLCLQEEPDVLCKQETDISSVSNGRRAAFILWLEAL